MDKRMVHRLLKTDIDDDSDSEFSTGLRILEPCQ